MSISIKKEDNFLILSILDFTEKFEYINGSLYLIAYDDDNQLVRLPLPKKLSKAKGLNGLEKELNKIYNIQTNELTS